MDFLRSALGSLGIANTTTPDTNTTTPDTNGNTPDTTGNTTENTTDSNSNQNTQPLVEAAAALHYAFSTDPCLDCQDPCDQGHPQLPDALAAKIELVEPLKGSVKAYTRHLFLCAGSPASWPEKIEKDPKCMPSQLSKVIDETAERMEKETPGVSAGRTIVTCIDRVPVGGGVDSETVQDVKETDLLLFPDFVSVQGVSLSRGSDIVSRWISRQSLQDDESIVPLEGDAYVFVCTHTKRDKRCGVAGPLLIDEFTRVIEDLGLEGKIHIIGASHYGGHKFAGNVIIYSKTHFRHGVWYGRVKTCHVESIVTKTIQEGVVFEELYRGCGSIVDSVKVSKKSW